VHERYRQTIDDRGQTDRQTDGRTTTYSEREREFTFAKKNCRIRIVEFVALVVVVVVVVALSWVKAEPLYPHHNYILG